jgi:hypothetical protein
MRVNPISNSYYAMNKFSKHVVFCGNVVMEDL